MSKVNTPPIGLQTLLGSQSFGENPDELLKEIRGAVDLQPYLQYNKITCRNSLGARATPGLMSSISFSNPWMPLLVSQRMVGAAGGGDIAMALRLTNLPNQVNQIFLAGQDIATMPAVVDRVHSWEPKNPLILPPCFLASVTTELTFNVTVQLEVLYVDLAPS